MSQDRCSRSTAAARPSSDGPEKGEVRPDFSCVFAGWRAIADKSSLTPLLFFPAFPLSDIKDPRCFRAQNVPIDPPKEP